MLLIILQVIGVSAFCPLLLRPLGILIRILFPSLIPSSGHLTSNLLKQLLTHIQGRGRSKMILNPPRVTLPRWYSH
ncbi:hypothetical protein IE53DRAFT_387524 [Violaceomyces palustris]|uniref:Uncharacterized protein n=1 Tax=Violaceomyces palustris TaxID=1673888 RepID=A0ACD0NWF4_9BASI|nr:hypothetical protein IE53DRAFT_387524 [Violaceomyces palustris]